MPRPGVLRGGAGVKIKVGEIRANAPGQIPRTVSQQVSQVLANPYVKGLLGAIGAGFVSGLLNPSQTAQRGAQLGNVQVPSPGVQPLPFPNPLTALQPAALPYASVAPMARAAVQEQDCSCRPARKKRKKKACKNPVTSRRSFKRGSKRFVTTTKELKCQA
jgi:hypothetical protein